MVFARPITLLPGSWVAAFFDLVEDFASLRLAAGITLAAPEAPPAETPDAAVDVRSLRRAWASMRGRDDFDALLRLCGVSHVQALRLASPDYVQAMPVASAHEVLTRAAQLGIALRVSVGNPGVTQTRSGPLQHVAMSGPWISVLDPGFKLHLREDHITSAWLVKRPTSDGLIHALELFDAAGQAIAVFAGAHRPGRAERCDWRSLLLSLSADAEADAV